MGLKIVYGRAGTGKSEYCYREIANLIKNKEKIYIITPEQFSFIAEKKLLEAIKEQAVLNAEVITFNRMAFRVINEVGGVNNNNITKCGKAMLIYSILNNQKKNLKFLGKNDENVELAMRTITELKKHEITIELIKEEINKVENIGLKNKLQDINIIYEQFQNQIKDNYIDETDLLTELSEKILQTNMFKGSHIYIDEFAGFTSQEYNIISKLLKVAKNVTITACIDNINFNTDKDSDVFYCNKLTISKILDILKEHNENFEEIRLEEQKRYKTPELQHLEKNIYENKYKQYKKETENIQLFLAQNQYSEIENVAKNIKKLVNNKGYMYKDISVITKNLDSYSNLAKAIFNQYEIPVFIDEKKDLSQNIIVQYILSVLEIFKNNWSTNSIFNYLKTGFINIDEEEIFKLENYATKWGIKQKKWKADFIYGKNKNNEQEIDRLNEIRKQIVEPLVKLKKDIDKQRTAENICIILYNFILEQNIREKLQEKIEILEQNKMIDLANEYKLSFDIILEILNDIVIVFKNEKITFEKFVQIFKVGLKNSGLGKIPATQDQVIIGDVDRSRSQKVKVVFIIGLNDGIFPSINKDEGFLNDSDRYILKEDGIELAKGTLEQLYEDNFNIYKAFSTSEEKLFLSYVATNSEGNAQRPSILITKIKKIFPKIKEKSDIVEKSEEIITLNTTYDELINNISKLKEGKKIDYMWYYVYKYYHNDIYYKQRLEKDLKSLNYTNLPDVIKKENIERIYGNELKTSISKLEKYRSCPFSYYLKYGLRIKEKEELKIKTLNTGTFMHEIIDEFFSTIREKDLELQAIEDEDIEKIVNKIINEKLNLSENYIFISSHKYIFLVKRLKKIVTKALKYIIESLLQSKFEVLGTELEFGEKSNYKPILIELDNGKKVEITGKIDRIDIGKNEEGKYIRIIDYKSSARNIDLNEVYAGLQIQLLTYIDSACKNENAMPAGILYFSLLEQMIKTNKNISEEEIEEKIRNNFKMKGLIIADINIIKMHDKDLKSGYSKLIPAYIDTKGNISQKKTSGVTKEQFEVLQKYIIKTIKDIAKEIYTGKVDIKPYYKEGRTPCKYCEYKSICGFNSNLCKKEYNYIDKKSNDEILNNMKFL